MTLVWSDFARHNLQNIYDRIAEYSRQHAESFINDLINAPEVLITHPRLGRIVPESNVPDVREVICRDYRVCYIIRGEVIYIASVLHGRQDVAKMSIKPWQH